MGTASELSLPKRVQLAVVAHIRHVYTDYDKLLKKVPYQQARAMVEQPSLDKMAQWRGDNDDDPNAMVAILEDVIVIPDDDEDEIISRTGSGMPDLIGRHASVEPTSNRDLVDEYETRPIDYGSSQATMGRTDSPDTDEHEGISLGDGQYFLDKYDPSRRDREGARRRQAWEEARGRLRQPHVDQRKENGMRPVRNIQSHGVESRDFHTVSSGRQDIIYIDERPQLETGTGPSKQHESIKLRQQNLPEHRQVSQEPIMMSIVWNQNPSQCVHVGHAE